MALPDADVTLLLRGAITSTRADPARRAALMPSNATRSNPSATRTAIFLDLMTVSRINVRAIRNLDDCSLLDSGFSGYECCLAQEVTLLSVIFTSYFFRNCATNVKGDLFSQVVVHIVEPFNHPLDHIRFLNLVQLER